MPSTSALQTPPSVPRHSSPVVARRPGADRVHRALTHLRASRRSPQNAKRILQDFTPKQKYKVRAASAPHAPTRPGLRDAVGCDGAFAGCRWMCRRSCVARLRFSTFATIQTSCASFR